ncbi:MAG: synthase subunit delta [Patescibacteria group bacterium]|jgi:F-type H+-transporting ATPase subunit delta|nr:synthase subunit delta [Patescibacteria group bacterium]
MISSSLIVKALKENLKDSKDTESLVLGLISYLKKNNLLSLLPNVLRKLELEKQKEEKSKTINITTSHDFDEDVIEKIKGYISKEKGDKFKIVVDENLIGGFVVKGKNKILDASIKRNLEFLRESLTK